MLLERLSPLTWPAALFNSPWFLVQSTVGLGCRRSLLAAYLNRLVMNTKNLNSSILGQRRGAPSEEPSVHPRNFEGGKLCRLKLSRTERQAAESSSVRSVAGPGDKSCSFSMQTCETMQTISRVSLSLEQDHGRRVVVVVLLYPSARKIIMKPGKSAESEVGTAGGGPGAGGAIRTLLSQARSNLTGSMNLQGQSWLR